MDPSAHSRSSHKLQNFTEHHINDSNSPPVFISGCESWLKPHITNAQVNIPGYQTVRQDRVVRDRGGVILYVLNSLPVSGVETFDDDICEAVICSVKSINTTIASIYRPPNTKFESFDKLLRFLQRNIQNMCNKHHSDLIIMGDFNLPGLKWHHNGFSTETNSLTESEELFINFMEANLLTQYITDPTRVTNTTSNTLDLFLTNNPNLVLHTKPEETNLSDHHLVNISTTYNVESNKAPKRPPIPERTFRRLNLQQADFESINSHLDSISWDDLKALCSPDEFPELLRLTILQVCMLYCKDKPYHTNMNIHTRNRKTLRRRKRKVKSQINAIVDKNPNSQKLDKLRAEVHDIECKIKESIGNQSHYKEKKAVEAIRKNPRYFFSYAKQFAKKKSSVGPLLNSDGTLEHNPKTMADILSNQYSSVFSDPSSPQKEAPNIKTKVKENLSNFEFSSEDIITAINEINENSACGENDIPAIILKKCKTTVAYPIWLIWEESLRQGYVPKPYKNQIITPVHKKASKAEAANYRPIALTSHIIKIFERIIRKHLVKHLEKNHLICGNQHGFRRGRSCLTQLLAHIDIILKNFLHGRDTDVIYLDYAKAFDKVDHQILLQKLYSYGVRGKLLMWLNSYLSNRWQTVVINGEHSNPAKVISGVPQGTVLGPVLFIIYLNDMESCIKSSIVSCFADDTRLKRSIDSVEDTTLLQEDLMTAIKWSAQNNMQLHESKFELVTHSTGRSKLIQELPYSTQFCEYITGDGSVISPCSAVRDLGVTIVPDLSWSPHINNTTNDCRKMISWIFSVFWDRSKETMLPLFKTLVRSRAEYCCILWHPSKVEDIKAIENIQRTFTSRISEVSDLHYWDRLQALNLLSLQRRRERYCIIQVFKILHDLTPNDLNLQFYQHQRRGTCCKLPPLVKNAKLKFQKQFDDSFSVLAPKLWNLVPKSIRDKKSLESFKTSLSKYIMMFPDHPPVPGISSQNSLLHLMAGYTTSWDDSEVTTDGGSGVDAGMAVSGGAED